MAAASASVSRHGERNNTSLEPQETVVRISIEGGILDVRIVGPRFERDMIRARTTRVVVRISIEGGGDFRCANCVGLALRMALRGRFLIRCK